MGARDAPTLAPSRAGAGLKTVTEALADLVAARARYEDPLPAEQDLADSLGVAMAAAELEGRWRVLSEADGLEMPRRAEFARASDPVHVHVLSLGDVRWKDLVDLFSKRDVRMASSAVEVAQKYARGNVFSLAQAASRIVAERVKGEIVKALQGRTDSVAAQKAIAELGDFTASYAETVFRTNVTGAYADGRIAMAETPAVRSVAPALRFSAIDDSRVRENHWAAHGVVMAVDDPALRVLKPPLGYRCRCRLDLVPYHELKASRLINAGGVVRRATIPRGAGPDPGFRIAA